MSLPGGTGFSGKQFWGIQLKPQSNNREKQVRVNADTELHISNVIVEFVYHYSDKPHEANCSFSVGVLYETDRCDCEIRESLINPGRNYCSSHPQQQQSGKNLTFYYSSNCSCNGNHSVNISGYVVRGQRG
uniref:Uncharacterized protein n=1 Tax=Daphnia galeata TaxID=27404 RepID=A0A8J2RPR8_9CRUS|nr:unnamed protein product [Daphnia galeata]